MAVRGSNRVNRGGSWNNNAENCESSNRNRNKPDNRNNNLGVRLVSSSLREKCSVHGCCAGTKEMTKPLSSVGNTRTKKNRSTTAGRMSVGISKVVVGQIHLIQFNTETYRKESTFSRSIKKRDSYVP